MDEIKKEMNQFGEKPRNNLEIYNEIDDLLKKPYFILEEILLEEYLNKLTKNVLIKICDETEELVAYLLTFYINEFNKKRGK